MALDNHRGGRRPHGSDYGSENGTKADNIHRKSPADGAIGQANGGAADGQSDKLIRGERELAWKSAHQSGGDTLTDGSDAFEKRDNQQERPDILRINSPGEGRVEVELERKRRSSKRKSSIRRIVLMVLVELITLVAIFCSGFVIRYMNMTQDVAFDVQKVKNPNLDITKQKQMEGYWTVAVFGVDARDGNLGKGTLADVQIIVNVDMGTGDIKMASVYRDSYLNTGKRYAKINEAYSIGGPEGAVAALNKNLDLDIENYATFNWKAVSDTINMLGGVEADVSKAEFREMNAYITETAIEAGITKNPAAHYLKGPGQQHLDGLQAVAYARLRHADTDFKRTERQRAIIEQLLAKAKKADLGTLTELINIVLPQISFNMDAGDILQLAKGISRYNIAGSTGFPTDLKTQMMGKKGDCVIPTTLASNVTALHKFLFNDEDYNPSSAVWTYSQRIAEDSGNYKSSAEASEAERKAAAEKESREAESSKKAESNEAESESRTREALETDRYGNIIETVRRSRAYETDGDGNYIDSEGEILETDRYGNVIESTAVRRSTAAADYETDIYGNLIDEYGRIVETDRYGYAVYESRRSSTESTREGELIASDPGSSTAGRSTEASTETRRSRSPGSGTETTAAVTPGGRTGSSTAARNPGSSSETTALSPGSSTGTTELSPGGDVINDEDIYNGPGTIVE